MVGAPPASLAGLTAGALPIALLTGLAGRTRLVGVGERADRHEESRGGNHGGEGSKEG